MPTFFELRVGKIIIDGFYATVAAVKRQLFFETKSVDTLQLNEEAPVRQPFPAVDISRAADFIEIRRFLFRAGQRSVVRLRRKRLDHAENLIRTERILDHIAIAGLKDMQW